MVKDKLEKIVVLVKPELEIRGFKRKGRSFDFIKKHPSDYMREEKISFTARQHRNDKDVLYIGCTVGIYYPMIRKVYRCMIDDHLFRYPIVAGSISHYSGKNEFMSVCYKGSVNEEEVVLFIKKELEIGAFNLLNTFPTLKELYKGIEEKHPFLVDFNSKNITKSTQIEIVCIICILKGLKESISWISKNVCDSKLREDLINKISECALP